MSWLHPPQLANEDDTRRAQLLYRLIGTMLGLAALGTTSALLAPTNDVRVTCFFYGLIFAWLIGMVAVVRRGYVSLAAWILSLLFWVTIAVVTILFGGLQGSSAATFTVCILLLGGVVGGRAALFMAIVTAVWCAFVVWLEMSQLLPVPLEPYSPINAWAAITITVLLTSVLLRTSIESLEKMHARAEQAARERDEALKRSIQGQKMELVGNLTSGIAHDFNNLLTVMSNVSGLLRSSSPSDEADQRSLLDDLDDATSRAALMTRQLLSFGRAPLQSSEILDLGNVVRGFERMLPRLLGSSISVVVEAPTGASIEASRGAIEQILLNLALNAKEAMPGGGRLSIRVEAKPDRVELTTEDTGVGMDEAVQTRVFEPFFTTKATGTGLGLATVRELVSQLHGKVRVESEPGRGARFEITFPRVPALAVEHRAVEAPSSPHAGGQQRLLLVEDDQLVRRSLSRWLVIEGFEVLAVADGNEALSMIESGAEFACVVSDISMPGLDGEQLASKLTERRPRLPLVLISGNRSPCPELLTAATRSFVQKPFALHELRLAITSVMRPG
jgi:signal transduction histidine kinase